MFQSTIQSQSHSSDDSNSQAGTSQKKTRRRLRLSCVECTKRRQKCDRKHPCSLCVARGVAHLCRWENVPVARPAPARPPVTGLSAPLDPNQDPVVRELRQRIVDLERQLEQSRRHSLSYTLPDSFGRPSVDFSNASQSSAFSSPRSDGELFDGLELPQRHLRLPSSGHLASSSHAELDVPMDLDEQTSSSLDKSASLQFPKEHCYAFTSAAAQLSLGHHGEFVGRGSLLCALYAIASIKGPRFLYAKSTDAVSAYKDSVRMFSNIPSVESIEELLPYIPSITAAEKLFASFFVEGNWRYGIPEAWFRSARAQMQEMLNQQQTHSSRPISEGPLQINANWLVLFFAVLASAPPSTYEDVKQHGARISDDYFTCAMMARRLVEDEYMNEPNPSVLVSAADGTVLGCLAVPLLCDYLAQRGRVSEAWKLIGHAIRDAEAVGMHRDPTWELWQMMSEDEKLLRRRAWRALYMADKIYSYVLGRTQILRLGNDDVNGPTSKNPDGSHNYFDAGQVILMSLMDLMSEALEQCFRVDYPDCEVYLAMDAKFHHWEANLPIEYQMEYVPKQLQDLSPSDRMIFCRQRYLIHSWYLHGRIKLHIASATGLAVDRKPQPPRAQQKSREHCVLLGLQIVRYQIAAYRALERGDSDGPGPCDPGRAWYFDGCYALFEASVGLLTTIIQDFPWDDKLAEANLAIQSAMEVFESVTRREVGKTREPAARALEVLTMIRESMSSSETDKPMHLNTAAHS